MAVTKQSNPFNYKGGATCHDLLNHYNNLTSHPCRTLGFLKPDYSTFLIKLQK